MDQTDTYRRVFPPELLERFGFAETRSAAAVLQGTSPAEYDDVVAVLRGFNLTLRSLTDAGGSKGEIARSLDLAFRTRGWREAGHTTETVMTMRLEPYRDAGEKKALERTVTYSSSGHKVDNVKGRVGLDVEWNAKDGNLDRDLANFRALYDAAVIDVGVIITRDHERTKYAANYLAEAANAIRYSPKGERIVLLGTSTTTNLEKLVPRIERGDGGGCPILVVAITDRSYRPKAGEPELPPFTAPVQVEGAAEPTEEDEASRNP